MIKDILGNELSVPKLGFVCYNVDKKRKEGIDTMDFGDPTIMQMSANLAEVAAKNTASAVFGKIKSFKANIDKDATISGMQQLIHELLDEKQELELIAKSYQEELVSQKLKESDLEFVVKTVIPAVKDFIKKSNAESSELENNMQNIEALEPLLSLNTLIVLQTLGFNYKKAIGEPLTNLISGLINDTSKDNLNKLNELIVERDLEYYKIIQNDIAFDRMQQLINK